MQAPLVIERQTPSVRAGGGGKRSPRSLPAHHHRESRTATGRPTMAAPHRKSLAERGRMSSAIAKKRILLLDDERAILVPIARYFQNLGCCVEIAEGADEAIALIRERGYDLAILDVRLSRLGGVEGLEPVGGGRWVEVTAGFPRLLGFAREELLGRPSVETVWPTPGDREAFLRTFEGGTTFREREVELRTKSGERRTFSISAEAVDLKGRPHLMTISRDVPDQNRMTEALRARDGPNPTFLALTPQPIGHSARRVGLPGAR